VWSFLRPTPAPARNSAKPNTKYNWLEVERLVQWRAQVKWKNYRRTYLKSFFKNHFLIRIRLYRTNAKLGVCLKEGRIRIWSFVIWKLYRSQGLIKPTFLDPDRTQRATIGVTYLLLFPIIKWHKSKKIELSLAFGVKCLRLDYACNSYCRHVFCLCKTALLPVVITQYRRSPPPLRQTPSYALI